MLAVVFTVCFTTTAFAAAYMGLDDKLRNFLNPVNHEQAQLLGNGVYAVNQQVANENGTLIIKQVIGDGNLTYLVMDFAAPKGMVLDAARYRFKDISTTIYQEASSFGFKQLDDGDPGDNRISLVMSIETPNSLAGQTVHFTFGDLEEADPLPGIFKKVVPGVWETTIRLDFKDYSTLYKMNRTIHMFGYQAVLTSVSVSPISISLKLSSESFKEIHEASEMLEEAGADESADNYPVTIHYKDGTTQTTGIFEGMHFMNYLDDYMFTIKTFDQVINDMEIESIEFFDQTMLLSH